MDHAQRRFFSRAEPIDLLEQTRLSGCRPQAAAEPAFAVDGPLVVSFAVAASDNAWSTTTHEGVVELRIDGEFVVLRLEDGAGTILPASRLQELTWSRQR